LVVELVDVVEIDVLPFPFVVVDETFVSDGCSRHCEAEKRNVVF